MASREFIRPYKPYTEEQWQRIRQLWDLYKNSFGLAGELFLKLKMDGKTAGQMGEEIQIRRDRLEKDLAAWRNLREGFGIN